MKGTDQVVEELNEFLKRSTGVYCENDSVNVIKFINDKGEVYSVWAESETHGIPFFTNWN